MIINLHLNPSLHKSPHCGCILWNSAEGHRCKYINVAPRMLEDSEVGWRASPFLVLSTILFPGVPLRTASAVSLSRPPHSHGSLHKSTDFWYPNFTPFDFGARTTPLSWKYCGAYVCTITCVQMGTPWTHNLIHTYHYAYSVVNCLELPGFGSK